MNTTPFVSILVALTVWMATSGAAIAESAASSFTRLFGVNPRKNCPLYLDETNPWVQELNAALRLQYQGAWVDGRPGNREGSRNRTSGFRRFRAGWNARVLGDVKLCNVWNVGGAPSNGVWNKTRREWQDHLQTTGSLYEAWAQYHAQRLGYTLALGKTNPEVFAENRVSSGRLKVPEFSIVESSVLFDSSWGVWASADKKHARPGAYAGVWSNTADGKRQTWGTWQSCFTTLGLSYGLDEVMLDRGRIHLDWAHSFAPTLRERRPARADELFTGPPCRDILAAYYIGNQGRFGLTAEVLFARMNGAQAAGNLFGIVVLPTYSLTERLEIVARAQYAVGRNAVDIGKNRYVKALQRRPPGLADRYWALGAGLNFYVYPQQPARLKVMTFLEYGNAGVSADRRAENASFVGWQLICGASMDF